MTVNRSVSGGLADDREIEAPFAKNRLRLLLLGRIEHHQHPLLAFRQQHFVSGHAGLAAGYAIEVECDSEIALGAHFDRRGGEARRAHVLNRDDRAGLHQFEAGFEQQLFGEWIADLHRWALFLRVGLESGRCHGRAMDSVAPGFRAEIDDLVADSAGLGVENLSCVGDPHRHRVDENIAVVALVEIRRAADGRHPEAIAIGTDSGDDARNKMARARMIWRAETQKVQACNRPRAHRENVAQDAANARRRALKGLDEGGVVMALHLEDAGLPIADVDDAGIFARPLDDPRRLGGKFAQVNARGFIRAMLVPHCRENTKLGEGRRTADKRKDAIVFVRLQAMRGNKLGGDGWVRAQGQWQVRFCVCPLDTHETFSRKREKAARRSRDG